MCVVSNLRLCSHSVFASSSDGSLLFWQQSVLLNSKNEGGRVVAERAYEKMAKRRQVKRAGAS